MGCGSGGAAVGVRQWGCVSVSVSVRVSVSGQCLKRLWKIYIECDIECVILSVWGYACKLTG